MPYVNSLRVSTKTWRTTFCLWMMALTPEAAGLARCVPGCLCTDWQQHFGFHWMPACAKLSYTTTRHSTVAAVLRRLFRKIGWEVLLKGQAGWVVGAPDLRPFDVPARPDSKSSSPWMGIGPWVADPSQHGYLNPGELYSKKATAAARHIHKKQGRCSRALSRYSLHYLVTYTSLSFEVSGGFTSLRRCTLCSPIWLGLLRHRRPAALSQSGHGWQ